MRQPLRVNFIGDHGLEEAGLGEGVTKEFLVELIRAGPPRSRTRTPTLTRTPTPTPTLT